MKIKLANRIAPDGTPLFAASQLALFYLLMSHKKDARLIWVKFHKKEMHTSSSILNHNSTRVGKLIITSAKPHISYLIQNQLIVSNKNKGLIRSPISFPEKVS